MKFPTVKVCGNTDPEIIKLCIELGAKLIGFVINYPKSPRSISINKLKKLTCNIPKNIKKVAVMVNPTINEVKEVSNYCNTIQLHGDEDNKFINIIKKLTNLEVIKVIKINKKNDLGTIHNYPTANEILLDTPAMGQSGEVFNFDLLKDIENNKYFLAGKIDINNVERALKYTDKIDVNSGLETEKGIKDPKKIKDFFAKVRRNED